MSDFSVTSAPRDPEGQAHAICNVAGGPVKPGPETWPLPPKGLAPQLPDSIQLYPAPRPPFSRGWNMLCIHIEGLTPRPRTVLSLEVGPSKMRAK